MREVSANAREAARATSPKQPKQEPQPEVYRERAFATVKEPARRKPVGWQDETTRTCGTEEYLGYGLAGTPNKTVYGIDPSEEKRSQAGHKAFKDALMQNVNGIGVKDSDRMWNQNDYLGDIGMNPSKNEKQRRYFGAELSRARSGQKTETGLPVKTLKDFARKPRGNR